MDAVLRKIFFGVVACLAHISSKSGKIDGNDRVRALLPQEFQQLFEAGAFKVSARPAVILKDSRDDQFSFRAILFNQTDLVFNAPGYALSGLIHGKTHIRGNNN